MPHYRFTAIDDQGKTLRGYREAASEAVLNALLRREGRWLAEVQETRQRKSTCPHRLHNRRIPQRILEQFFLSLSLQLNAGVDLVAALSFSLPSDASAAFVSVHGNLLERVKAGTPLSDAMAAHPRSFSVVVVNLIKAGEASGRLGEVCEEVRRHFEWSERLRGDIKQALIYPIALLFAAATFFCVVFTFFIPRFSGVLKELGVPLPWITRAMIHLSEWILNHSLAVGAAVLLPPLLGYLAFQTSPAFARWIDGLKLRLPFIGSILWQSCLGRLTHNLSTLYRAGIPLLDALRLCVPIVGNRLMQASLVTIHDGVAAGRTLHESMSGSTLFPPMVVQMTALGETTGTLDASLQSAANYYDIVIPRTVKKLFTVFEPVMILLLLVVVGTIVLSVFLPIASALDAR